MLKVLDSYQVKATFFVLGRMVVKHKELVREMAAAGHEIALHGYEHQLLLRRRPRAVKDDLTRGWEVIRDVLGTEPTWYRPPYGVLTSSALLTARRLNLTPVLWTAWGRDWTEHATATSVSRTVTGSLAPGGTILLHDSDTCSFPGSWRATLGALPGLVERAQIAAKVGPLREHGIR